VVTDMGAHFRIDAAMVARLIQRGHAARRAWSLRKEYLLSASDH
jgi:hypothetical protein